MQHRLLLQSPVSYPVGKLGGFTSERCTAYPFDIEPRLEALIGFREGQGINLQLARLGMSLFLGCLSVRQHQHSSVLHYSPSL